MAFRASRLQAAGQGIVELALLLPLICLLLFGTIDTARYIRATVELNHAAEVGVRTAINSYQQGKSGVAVTNHDVVNAVEQAYPAATVVVPSDNSAAITTNSSYTVTLVTKFGVITPFVATLKDIQAINVTSTGTSLP